MGGAWASFDDPRYPEPLDEPPTWSRERGQLWFLLAAFARRFRRQAKNLEKLSPCVHSSRDPFNSTGEKNNNPMRQ